MFAFYQFMYDLVGFSRSQSNGFLILLPLLFGILFSQPISRAFLKNRVSASASDIRKLDSLVALWPVSDSTRCSKKLFPFDPNAALTEELSDLGFASHVCRRIVNYRSKGGRFRIKKDLLKIHGVDSGHYLTLVPFIQLPEAMPANNGQSKARNSLKPPLQIRFDLNNADTIQLQSIHGIGQRLALRIWKYRDALGGFMSQNQLYEVYKLDSIVVNRLINKTFIEKGFEPRRLNINTANQNELAAHPYLSHKMAGVIVAYRFQHGKFTSLEDLRNLPGFDSVTLTKLNPYLLMNE